MGQSLSDLPTSISSLTSPQDTTMAAAQMYKYGFGSQDSIAQAKELFQRAADEGKDVVAMYFLGEIHETEENYAAAKKHYEQGGELGYGPCWFKLAGLYNRGFGVEENKDTADTYYTKAVPLLTRAPATDSISWNALAQAHRFGLGTAISTKEAEWAYLKAANAGHPDAQYVYAQTYAADAVDDKYKWMHQSNEQGHPSAAHWCKLNSAASLI